MAISPDIVEGLAAFRRLKIAMPARDTLKDGRDLVTVIQMECPFPLCYVQRLGCDPAVMIWRVRDEAHAMEGYTVGRYQA
jgi:hypothetical protein